MTARDGVEVILSDARESLAAESADVGMGICGVGKAEESVAISVAASAEAEAVASAEEAEEMAPTGIGMRVGMVSESDASVLTTMGVPSSSVPLSLPPLSMLAYPGSGSSKPLQMKAKVSNLPDLSQPPSDVPRE